MWLFMSVALLAGLVVNYLLKVFWVDYLVTLVILIFVQERHGKQFTKSG